MSKLRVALLAGGISAEREVSLKSGEMVARALDKDRYEVVRYDPRDDLKRLVEDSPGIDVALIIMHGRFGEDGTIQGLLELLKVPFLGSGVLGSALGMDKVRSKYLYEKAGLPVSPYRVVFREEGPDRVEDMLAEHPGLPLVVKPAREGSSIGLSIVMDRENLGGALEKAFAYDRELLVEKYLEGTELTVGVLGNSDPAPLPVVEIIPGEGYEFFDYEAKYKPGATEEICPARIPDEVRDAVQDYGVRAHRALCCRGLSRTDMIMAEDGSVVVLETNTIPGMTETSLYPQAAAAHGLPFPKLLDRLIELALEEI